MAWWMLVLSLAAVGPRSALPISTRGDAVPTEFDRIYAEHFDFVWRTLRGLGAPASAADDLTQEVFLVAFRRLSTLENRGALRSWLFGIARRVGSDYRRAQGRRGQSVEFGAHGAGEGDVGAAPDAEGDLARKRALDVMRKYAAGLDEEHRALFFLTLVEGQTVADAAEALGSNVNTTYSRVRVMRAELAQALGHKAAEGGDRGPAR